MPRKKCSSCGDKIKLHTIDGVESDYYLSLNEVESVGSKQTPRVKSGTFCSVGCLEDWVEEKEIKNA